MGAYAGAASQPQIMATNNAFKNRPAQRELHSNGGEKSCSNSTCATVLPPGTVGLPWIDNCSGFFVNIEGS